VGHDRAEQVGLVGGQAPTGDVGERALAFEFREDVLLLSSALDEAGGLLHRASLVGDQALEIVSIFLGLEQIQLKGTLRLLGIGRPDEHEAGLAPPGLRLPHPVERSALPVPAGNRGPAGPALRHLLELAEALEGRAYGVFDPQALELANHGVAEEGRVHPDLDPRRGNRPANALDAGLGEPYRSVGVVDVPAAVQGVECLAALGDRAEERIVAAHSLLFVVARRDAFGLAAGRDDASVKVQGHSRELLQGQPVEDERPDLGPHPGYASRIAALQHPAYRRHAGDRLDSQSSPNDGILPVEVDVAKLPHSEQSVDEEQAEEQRVARMPGGCAAGRAAREPGGEPQFREKLLEDDQAAVGAQVLPLEFEGRDGGFSCSEEWFW